MFRKRRPDLGSRPGMLVAPDEADPTIISVIDYDSEQHEEKPVSQVQELAHLLQTETVSWIDVQGLRNVEVLRELAELFGIHPLAIEAAVHVPSRPRAEAYDDHHLVVTRMFRVDPQEGVQRDQVTLFVGRNFLITVQEHHGDVFDPVRNRTRKGPRMRHLGPDYLAYALIDAIVDSGYSALEHYAEQLERLERRVISGPTAKQIPGIFDIRHSIVDVRRAVQPQRDAIAKLLRDETPFFSDDVLPFLRDCLDHASQVSEVLESNLSSADNLMDLHQSLTGNRMNEIMKVLTIMASIFIPLSFMAGVYGMNFERMPELAFAWGYPILLALMALIGGGLLLHFRARGWIGEPDSPEDDDEDDEAAA